MALKNLNMTDNGTTAHQMAVVSADDIQYTVNGEDVVSRITHPTRINSHRTMTERVTSSASEAKLDYLLSQTGAENNVARRGRFVCTIRNEFKNLDGSVRTCKSKVSIIKSSLMFDYDREKGTAVLVPMVKWLQKYGFWTKNETVKKGADDMLSIPRVAAFNNVHKSVSGNSYVGGIEFTAMTSNGLNDGKNLFLNVSALQNSMPVDEFERACRVVIDDADEKVSARTLNFVRAMSTVGLCIAEDAWNHQNGTKIEADRELFRKVGLYLGEVYFGVAPGASENATYTGIHCLLGGMFDIAQQGGGFETRNPDAVLAGHDFLMPVLNNGR